MTTQQQHPSRLLDPADREAPNAIATPSWAPERLNDVYLRCSQAGKQTLAGVVDRLGSLDGEAWSHLHLYTDRQIIAAEAAEARVAMQLDIALALESTLLPMYDRLLAGERREDVEWDETWDRYKSLLRKAVAPRPMTDMQARVAAAQRISTRERAHDEIARHIASVATRGAAA